MIKKLIERRVIEVTVLWGQGVVGDPVREVVRYYDPETGITLAVRDPLDIGAED
jgi:hypothetical protein